MSAALQSPVQVMKFTLTFFGELPPSGNKPKPAAVWAIREQFHPQIEELFATHPALRNGFASRFLPPIAVQGGSYRPLLRKAHDVICSVDITFLRKEDPGQLVKQDGDIDNRIKTLFDGLRMPNKGDAIPAGKPVFSPMCALLEDDSLITGLSVKTDRLLGVPSGPPTWVYLLVEVRTSVSVVTMQNATFLGD